MRILLLSPYTPVPTNSGAAQRTSLLINALEGFAEVDLALVGESERFSDSLLDALRKFHRLVAVLETKDWRKTPLGSRIHRWIPRASRILLEDLWHERHRYSADPEALRQIRRIVSENGYSAIVSRYLLPARRSGAFQTGLPVFVDIDDVDIEHLATELQQRTGSIGGRLLKSRRLRQLHECHADLVRPAKALWIPNPGSRSHPGLRDAIWLPNIPFRLPDPGTVITPGSDVLFLGILNYRANLDGLDWFLGKVWPIIRQARSDARFRIAGGGELDSERRTRWLGIPGVVLQGFVETVDDAYRGAAFSIAPVLMGSGTNIKVVESLAYGRTVVVTRFAHRGFEETLHPGQSLLLGETPEAFAGACLELLNDSQRASSLAANGLRAVQEFYSFESFRSVVRTTVLDGMRW